MLKFKSLLVALISLSLVVVACDSNQDAGADEPTTEAAEAEAAAEPEEEAQAEPEAETEEEPEELAEVDVPEEGKVFDPAVEKEQIPAGAWFCDMGDVHYARMEEGDGTCPECHMKLKQKAGEDEETAEADDHAGHDHAGHNHE